MNTQRILIKTTHKGTVAQVQIGNRSISLTTPVTQAEAWTWAKTVLDLAHEQHATAAASEATEVMWNGVL